MLAARIHAKEDLRIESMATPAPGAVSTAFREGVSQLHWKTVGDALVRFAQHSGPVLTKLGQVLATRNDVLPDAVCERLQALYARQPPMTDGELSKLLKMAFPAGMPFTKFERIPMAVGSIGQVHRACLPGLTKDLPVVIKLLRPGIERAIDRDLNAAEVVWDLALKIRGTNGTRSEEAIGWGSRAAASGLRAAERLGKPGPPPAWTRSSIARARPPTPRPAQASATV